MALQPLLDRVNYFLVRSCALGYKGLPLLCVDTMDLTKGPVMSQGRPMGPGRSFRP